MRVSSLFVLSRAIQVIYRMETYISNKVAGISLHYQNLCSIIALWKPKQTKEQTI